MRHTIYKYGIRLDYKYGIRLDDEVRVRMPAGAKLLDAQPQEGMLSDVELWALVDLDARLVDRLLYILGTGHDAERLPVFYRHVSTVQLHRGQLVFHIFDGGECASDPVQSE